MPRLGKDGSSRAATVANRDIRRLLAVLFNADTAKK
jgi:hypothetical protein